MTDEYKSLIPDNAVEQIVARFPDGKKERAEYLVNGIVIGHRRFYESGEMMIEMSQKKGLKHGTEYWWDESGHLDEAYAYEDGLEHGIHKQFSVDGQIIGTYTMERGTGIDLWWGCVREGVRYKKDGKRHGFEWWLWGDPQGSVSDELHHGHSDKHVIQRSWRYEGKLRRGYPRYFIHGVQVNKAKYIRACASDQTLPPFRIEDNDPHRSFPPEIQPHLGAR